MRAPVYLQVMSPEEVLFEGNVCLVRFPGKSASFTVMKDHAPIMSLLERGFISYEGEMGDGRIPVSSGFVQVRNNKVYACIIQKLL
ncbi:MAG: F0F1 ATP synthase subunit epsilon [Bacteroidales bacterium]|jgi:F-type H+-transporting ATPase subunit epsilon